MAALVARLFPLWAVIFSLAALFFPGFFSMGKPAIIPLLGVVMFGMGATLAPEDFRRAAGKPQLIGLGIAMQYLLMPFAGWVVSLALGLDPMLMAGVIIVGSCPGGTASNVVAYLAKADVALSITLTFVSTLAAVGLTPVLTWIYAGQRVDVPVWDMTLSVFKIVLIPVATGVLVNHLFGGRMTRAKEALPAISVAAIVIIISVIVGLNAQRLGSLAGAVALAVVAHNLFGLAGGYFVSWILGFDEKTRRTMAIETGMQNSGLAVALAMKYFGPAAALPGAFFSIWHNLSGAFLAAYWTRGK